MSNHYEERFKRGDRVILLDNGKPSNRYPLWGSAYSSVGTVVTVGGVLLLIKWDNGEEGNYPRFRLYQHDGELRNPNRAFLIKKKGGVV